MPSRDNADNFAKSEAKNAYRFRVTFANAKRVYEVPGTSKAAATTTALAISGAQSVFSLGQSGKVRNDQTTKELYRVA